MKKTHYIELVIISVSTLLPIIVQFVLDKGKLIILFVLMGSAILIFGAGMLFRYLCYEKIHMKKYKISESLDDIKDSVSNILIKKDSYDSIYENTYTHAQMCDIEMRLLPTSRVILFSNEINYNYSDEKENNTFNMIVDNISRGVIYEFTAFDSVNINKNFQEIESQLIARKALPNGEAYFNDFGEKSASWFLGERIYFIIYKEPQKIKGYISMCVNNSKHNIYIQLDDSTSNILLNCIEAGTKKHATHAQRTGKKRNN